MHEVKDTSSQDQFAEHPITVSSRRLFATVALGNMLVWFDIAIYGFFALHISRAFFPSHDPALALMLTFATFAISFVVRPIGALALGRFADRRGRKRSLVLSAVLMSAGAGTVAFMPTYEMIGLIAPCGVLLARIIQGFAAGGEFGSSTAILAEARNSGLSFATSWQLASQMLSGALAAGSAAALTILCSPEAMQSWGWRVPFLVGMLVGPVGMYIRTRLPEFPPPDQLASPKPVRSLLTQNKARLAAAVGAVAVSTGVTYLLTFLPTFAVQSLSLPSYAGHLAAMTAFLVQIPLTLWSGALADRVGGNRIMWCAALIMLATFAPAFYILSTTPGIATLFILILWFAVVKAMYSGPLAAALIEVMPRDARATGTALAYNLAVALFGASGPLIMSWLGQFASPSFAPAIYMTFLSLVSIGALFVMHRMPKIAV